MSLRAVTLTVSTSDAKTAPAKGDQVYIDLSHFSGEIVELKKQMKVKSLPARRLPAEWIDSLHRQLKASVTGAGYYVPAGWCHSQKEVDAVNLPFDAKQLNADRQHNNKRSTKIVTKFLTAIDNETVS